MSGHRLPARTSHIALRSTVARSAGELGRAVPQQIKQCRRTARLGLLIRRILFPALEWLRPCDKVPAGRKGGSVMPAAITSKRRGFLGAMAGVSGTLVAASGAGGPGA